MKKIKFFKRFLLHTSLTAGAFGVTIFVTNTIPHQETRVLPWVVKEIGAKIQHTAPEKVTINETQVALISGVSTTVLAFLTHLGYHLLHRFDSYKKWNEHLVVLTSEDRALIKAKVKEANLSPLARYHLECVVKNYREQAIKGEVTHILKDWITNGQIK